MISANVKIPQPHNEPVFDYAPGSAERRALRSAVDSMLKTELEIPMIIGGKEVRSGNFGQSICPHDHGHVLAKYHQASAEHVEQAVAATRKAAQGWAEMSSEARLSIFLKAAELLATKYRQLLNASTLLGQSKSPLQAEVDAACELIDFLRINPYYAAQLSAEQPLFSPNGTWNYVDHRPLEGFIFAVTPFNFTSIAGNLCSAPAMMGNTVIWKPASTAVHSGYYLMKLFQEAGLPDGVINFLPGRGSELGKLVMAQPSLAGVHFTGSTGVFQNMWRTVGENIANYRSYPRIVGETGGKDFIVAHPSADADALRIALIRGAFEYQGQKCSAASRAYLPESVFAQIKADLLETTAGITMGDPTNFSNFMGAVIDANAYSEIKGYIDFAKQANDAKVLVGGECDDSTGYFIRPTIVHAESPKFKLMQEEIFGPVLTIYTYPDADFEKALELCDETSPYALTGAIFANDREAVNLASRKLRHAAGNFYINDKPTGAVVGQQPFGGGRASGTNDKAGSVLNLLRWVSPRAIKENFIPPHDYRYPHMKSE